MSIKKIIFLAALSLIFIGCRENPIDFDGVDSSFLDNNRDGVDDVSYEITENGYFQLIDRNFDTKMDESVFFGKDELPIKSKSDDDFDGYMETQTVFKDGLPEASVVDVDLDGKYDLFFQYRHGVLLYAEQFILNDSGKNHKIKRITFKYYFPIKEEFIDVSFKHRDFHKNFNNTDQ